MKFKIKYIYTSVLSTFDNVWGKNIEKMVFIIEWMLAIKYRFVLISQKHIFPFRLQVLLC